MIDQPKKELEAMNFLKEIIIYLVSAFSILVVYTISYSTIKGIEVEDVSSETMSVLLILAIVTSFIIQSKFRWKSKRKISRRQYASQSIQSKSNLNAVEYFTWLSLPRQVVQGFLVLDRDRFKHTILRFQSLISYRNGQLSPRKIFRSFEKEEVIADFYSFLRQYSRDLIDEVHGNKSPNLKNENCRLFFQLASSKYDLSHKEILALAIYLYEELVYQSFFESLSQENFTYSNEIIEKIVFDDIKRNQKTDSFILKRFLQEKGFHSEARSVKAVEERYESIKEKIKLDYFQSQLTSPQTKRNLSIEEVIRNDSIIETLSLAGHIPDDIRNEKATYTIVGTDFSRDSRIDNFYKKRFDKVLSRAFEGHCCKCGRGMGQLEFDHFWFPKSKGGNFLMRHKEKGIYINNCVPLCRSCNAQKGDRDFTLFFTSQDLGRIFSVSHFVTQSVNPEMLSFSDPDFPGRLI